MPTFHQQLTWHIKKEDLEKLLKDAGDNYSALAFTLGIDDKGDMQYQVSLVNTVANNNTFSLLASAPPPPNPTVRACPVPPDCR